MPGGGTLYFKRRTDLPIVSINALFRGGKRNETRTNSGITSLMLKSVMKGTRSCTAEELAERIESLGSGIGLSLTADYFGYGVKLRKEALQEGVRLFAEVVAHPTFPDAEVEREKQSIYAEIRRQQDNNFSLAFDQFSAACYGDHPYGLPANGLAEAVETLTPDDLRHWRAQHLVAGNLFVGIVGDLEEEEAVALLTTLLDGDVKNYTAPPVPLIVQPSGERILQRPKKQTATVLGFPGANVTHPDRYALDMLSEITSGMGGRFFRTVRGENALAYQVTSFHRSRLDAGNYIAYTSTAPENAQKAQDLLLGECEKLKQEPVTPEELATAKAVMVGEHAIGTQSFGAQAGELASCAVYGLPPDEPQRYLARIQQITADDIQEAAQRYLRSQQKWLGIVQGGAEAKPE